MSDLFLIFLGKICSKGQDNSSDHTCKKLNDCPFALQNPGKNVQSKVCSANVVDADNPIVCCQPVKTYSALESMFILAFITKYLTMLIIFLLFFYILNLIRVPGVFRFNLHVWKKFGIKFHTQFQF